ncbi:MAG: CYTH domain-containing protein [Capnocytophaga sp.]|nr:CYTH domain-containing protein [Capnocytophaga sp.]
MNEIERKFLVKNERFKAGAMGCERIVQAFLNTDPERTVRVRIKGGKAYLTVKGIGNELGTTRFEWEKEISVADAESLLPLCEPGVIDKVRYMVPYQDFMFEVDVFGGSHEGLLIAEVELDSEHQKYPVPDWLGEEVTGKVEYYNSYLAKAGR